MMTLTEEERACAMCQHINGLLANHNGPYPNGKAQSALWSLMVEKADEWAGLDPTERPSIKDYLETHVDTSTFPDAIIDRVQRPYA